MAKLWPEPTFAALFFDHAHHPGVFANGGNSGPGVTAQCPDLTAELCFA
ncbi:MAG: hypothetical protein RLZZ232_3355 [Planctomycetota bacterium]|jgi:hypothetical protein